MSNLQVEQSQPVTKEFSIKAILPVILALITGMLLVMLDSTIMNVAIPQLEKTFDASLKTIQWAITGYTLALSVIIPLAGWFSDKFTAKRVFLASIVLFPIGSLLCSMAQSTTELIIFRILQGLGGGMIAPIGMAMSFKIAPPDKRGSIMGLLGLPMLIAPVLGPVLSGWLLEYASWHWIFLINVPIGIIAMIVGVKFLPVIEKGNKAKLDIWGVILSPLAFSSLVFGVHRGGVDGWGDRITIISLAFSFIALALFIFVELRQKEPLLELRSFRSLEFSKGMILTWINQFALFGSILLIPIFLQQVRGFSSFESGLLVIPQALISFAGMIIGGKLFDKYGARPVVFSGLVLLSTGLFLLSRLQNDTSVYVMISYFAIMGLGQGLTTMQLGTHVLKAAPKDLISRVTPLTASAQQIVGSFAVAIMSGLLTSNIATQMSQGNQKLPLEAMVAGFHDTFLVSLGLALCGVVLSLFLHNPKS
ncbi:MULTISPECIES: MDR family MFS transporter [Paenibacillus]|uniref:MDR family MFS transporter n=1 Tax=Paenibacillus TaxID=44249 RepID=UPI00096D229E|nr:MDR family MFS transporter [Paenibacillus odorifer]OME51604.1 MFS transporter [Paenibacillus odorifer]